MTIKFINLLPQLNAIEFVGLAKVLGVSLGENNEPREAHELIDDTIESFNRLGRKQKRDILKMLRQAISIQNGPTTKDR